MVQKPKIQYIGQFYVHGSEAIALELEEQRKQKDLQEKISGKVIRSTQASLGSCPRSPALLAWRLTRLV